ncbi:hypothetical protein J6590_068605 [Homalodisca vitripennis]|nr:hypothetical protein J6590_068605 [Homalodisca vitripennis]
MNPGRLTISRFPPGRAVAGARECGLDVPGLPMGRHRSRSWVAACRAFAVTPVPQLSLARFAAATTITGRQLNLQSARVNKSISKIEASIRNGACRTQGFSTARERTVGLIPGGL